MKKIKNLNFSNSISKFKQFISEPKVKYTFMTVFLLVLAFIIQYFLNRPNFGTFLSSDMDPSSNVYILGVDEKSGVYKITKVSSSGATKFQIDLERSNNENAYVYSNLEVDSKGNIYFVKQRKDLKAVVSDKSMYPTISETVLMYDTDGNYVKQIAARDFSKDATQPTEPYIRKIQTSNDMITLIGCENNRYDIITANPLTDESPRKIKTFEVSANIAPTSQKYQWVNDVSVLSTGRIFYSTLNGELYATNNEGQFENYSSIMENNSFQVVSMNVDNEDNLYFNDCVNGKFYKLNTKSGMIQSLYDLESPLAENLSIKMKDVRGIKLIESGDFYAPSKAFDKSFHVRFGTQTKLVGDLRGALFPWGYIIMLSVIIVGIGLFYAIRYLINTEIKRIPLAVRILAMFLPVFLISMGVLVWVNTSDGVKEYISVLRSEQERGAKTAAEIIDGSSFSKLNHISGYMSAEYVKLKNDLQKGYNEVSLKIGDRSDYIVTYIESRGKLYTTLNTRYDVNSGSYERLKYTTPDMISPRYALVDYLLEQDESKTIYDVWNALSDKTNAKDSMYASFRDVYGDISASFVPIKDTSGKIVGMVGNFLDEGIHSTREFWEILKHTSALIIVVTFLIGGFICFIIKWSLKPLKTLEKAIDTIGKGKWNTRIRVETKDELADIAQAFNIMSEKIDRYTSNLIRLNKEYIRYVPKEIFKFMEKEKITQVELHSHKVVKTNIVYLSFNLSCKECFDFKNEDEIFDAVNLSYEEIFKVVENNNGVVQSFDGLDAVILFPINALDALNASIQFKEVNLHKEIKKRMNITLGAGEVLVGVSGNEDRRGVIVISDEIMQLFNIDSRLKLMGINHVATGNIIENLRKDHSFNYRYLGRAENPTDSEDYADMYQIIDGSGKYKRDLYLSTKELFEKGVELYLNREFAKARKIFTEVLRINENDKVSIKYLMLCEKQSEKQEKLKNFDEIFNGYII